MDEASSSSKRQLTVESLIDETGGCGLFQGLILLGAYGCLIPICWTSFFMAFGNYIPGWQCLDADINQRKLKSLVWNETTMTNGNKSDTSCEVFEKCHRIEFDKETSSIVSEWGLLCNRQWVTSFIISMQMVGLLIGSFSGGRLVDIFGRKFVLFGSVLTNGFLSLIAAYSVNWQMFTVLKLLLGIPSGAVISCVFIFPAEFLPIRWRGIVSTLPVWGICALMFAALTAVLRDWKSIHIANGVISLLVCLAAFWIPESMRWLATNGKLHEAEDVIRKIAKTNGKSTPDLSVLGQFFLRQGTIHQSDKESKTKYRFVDIFRRGLCKRTLITSFTWLILVIVNYAILFNIKGLVGDFYLNFSLFACISIVAYPIVPWTIENLGRKFGIICFFSIACLCCYSNVIVSFVAPMHIQNACLNVFSLIAYGSLECGWAIIVVYTYELFPTIVRGFGFGCASGMSRFGGIIAPYLIPQNQDTFYIFYLVYGTGIFVSGFFLFFLPETKGLPLKDILDKDQTEDEENHCNKDILDFEC